MRPQWALVPPSPPPPSPKPDDRVGGDASSARALIQSVCVHTHTQKTTPARSVRVRAPEDLSIFCTLFRGYTRTRLPRMSTWRRRGACVRRKPVRGCARELVVMAGATSFFGWSVSPVVASPLVPSRHYYVCVCATTTAALSHMQLLNRHRAVSEFVCVTTGGANYYSEKKTISSFSCVADTNTLNKMQWPPRIGRDVLQPLPSQLATTGNNNWQRGHTATTATHSEITNKLAGAYIHHISVLCSDDVYHAPCGGRRWPAPVGWSARAGNDEPNTQRTHPSHLTRDARPTVRQRKLC